MKIAQPYLKSGQIESIQLSTRPDYINADILDNLQQYGVRTIELGAQSLDNEVLKKSGRGHTVEEVEQASVLIKQYGFELGLQMMVGLPGDSFEKSMLTAQTIAKFKADYTRIYPTLVIKDTDLEKLYLAGQYTPLSLEEAVRWSKELLKFFTFHHITILRMGLHPSEGLLTGSSLVAGPFHISFRELVLTSLFEELIFSKINQDKKEKIIIRVSPKQINAAIGYYSQNRNKLETIFKDVKFKTDETLKKGCLTIEYE
ncbi:MAG: radical SAM protein [Bacteroidales bacterium]